jgi:hypothetical protein
MHIKIRGLPEIAQPGLRIPPRRYSQHANLLIHALRKRVAFPQTIS